MKNFTLIGLAILSLTGCQTATTTLTPSPDNTPVLAKKPTEQRMCTMQYDPVCGKIDNNGIISYKTYGNACTASNSPENVQSYTKGACGSSGDK